MNCVTLLTDFGLADEYVGVMKGVITTIHPAATVIDISHGIPPQDIDSAARMLRAAYRYFPKNTIHVCVVDPGVGTDRAIIAAHADDHVFIAPDNGVLFPILHEAADRAIVRVENTAFFLPDASDTFHGRDIFAPVAGHLLRGVSIGALGSPLSLDRLAARRLSQPCIAPDGSLVGTIIHADRFGNLLTDIERRHIDTLATPGNSIEIMVGKTTISGLSGNYAGAKGNTCLAVIGSRGYLEIAVSSGSALGCLAVSIGDPVSIHRKPAARKRD